MEIMGITEKSNNETQVVFIKVFFLKQNFN